MDYKTVQPSKADRKKFDLNLSEGIEGEKLFLDVIKSGKVEVKSEQGKWSDTNNICIEFESYGKPSGIEVTEADYWVQNLMVDGKHYATIVMPKEVLKEVVGSEDFRWVKGGDHNASKMWLVSLSKLFSKSTVMKALGLWKKV